jgi:hypothetical protein
MPVRGIADILTTNGMVVDIKTDSRKPSGLNNSLRRVELGHGLLYLPLQSPPQRPDVP